MKALNSYFSTIFVTDFEWRHGYIQYISITCLQKMTEFGCYEILTESASVPTIDKFMGVQERVLLNIKKIWNLGVRPKTLRLNLLFSRNFRSENPIYGVF